MNPPQAQQSTHRGLYSVLVDRPVLTLMITIAMLVIGALSLYRLPLTFMGDAMMSSSINVTIPISQSRSPRETEDKVARPAEELLRMIPGIASIRVNCSANQAQFTLELDSDLDPVLAAAEIRDRMQRAMLEMPEGVDRYYTYSMGGGSTPLQMLQVLTPDQGAEWQNKVENIVIPRIEAVDGVGRVDFWGLRQESVRIWFDQDKVYANRVDYRDLLQRLSSANFAASSGEVESDSERVLLRIENRFRTLQDIEEFPVRPGLKVKDIARVERDRSEKSQLSRFNGQYSFMGTVTANSTANPVETSQRVLETTDELEADPRLAGIDFRYMFDQGQFIESGLDNLFQASSKGGLLALLVLFLFLRNVRATIVIGLAIPLTMLLVADYLYFTGGSLNILTMTGMTLAVGMVVDNSVVVLENIRRLRHDGVPLRTACVEGAREMGLAVTMATLTTVVVFLPIVFMNSDNRASAMFGSVGIPLSVALVGSLFVALLLLPSGVRRLGGVSAANEIRWHVWSPINALTRSTLAVLTVLLAHRYKVLLGSAAYLVLLMYGQSTNASWKKYLEPWPHLDFDSGMHNPFGGADVRINLLLPKGLDDQDVEDEVTKYETFLSDNEDRWHIESISSSYSRKNIRLDVQLLDEVPTGDLGVYDWQIRDSLPLSPGVELVVGYNPESGAAEEEDLRNFVVRIRGRDSEHLSNLSLDLQERLTVLPEVEMVEVSSARDNEEVLLDVDRDRLQDLGVNPQSLFGTVSGGLQGRELTRFEEAGRDVRIVAQFADGAEPSLTDLREVLVIGDQGGFQRIGDLTQVRFQQTLGSISRLDGKTTVSMVGRRAAGVGPTAFSDALEETMKGFPLPRGYEWSEDSMAQETAAQIWDLVNVAFLSVTLVFLLMAILFESVILPAAILVTIVFAVIGGLWALALFYGAIDTMAVTGLLLLAGVVVNNGIVLLDTIERLRRRGMPRAEAIREGIRIRLRPIFMTAATTIVGLLPMAIWGESSGQGVSYVSMSICVAGGLALCTLVTAPSVSLAYTWLDDLSHWLQSSIRTAMGSARLK